MTEYCEPGETAQVPIPRPPGPFIVPGVALLPVTEKCCGHEGPEKKVMIPNLGPERRY